MGAISMKFIGFVLGGTFLFDIGNKLFFWGCDHSVCGALIEILGSVTEEVLGSAVMSTELLSGCWSLYITAKHIAVKCSLITVLWSVSVGTSKDTALVGVMVASSVILLILATSWLHSTNGCGLCSKDI